jgi:hypothetical protein
MHLGDAVGGALGVVLGLALGAAGLHLHWGVTLGNCFVKDLTETLERLLTGCH